MPPYGQRPSWRKPDFQRINAIDPFIGPSESAANRTASSTAKSAASSGADHTGNAAIASIEGGNPPEDLDDDALVNELLGLAGGEPGHSSPPPEDAGQSNFSPIAGSRASSPLSRPPSTPKLPDHESDEDEDPVRVGPRRRRTVQRYESPEWPSPPPRSPSPPASRATQPEQGRLDDRTPNADEDDFFRSIEDSAPGETSSKPDDEMTEVVQQPSQRPYDSFWNPRPLTAEELRERSAKADASIEAFVAKIPPPFPMTKPVDSTSSFGGSSFSMFQDKFKPTELSSKDAEKAPSPPSERIPQIDAQSSGLGDSRHAFNRPSTADGDMDFSQVSTLEKTMTVRSGDADMDTGSSSQPPSGRLFGTAQPTKPNASLANPFGGNQNQQSSAPASNSLFSGISAPNPSTSQPNSSPFGGATASSTGGGGLFGGGGGGATTSGTLGGSLFGTSIAQSSQPPSSSLFANAAQASSSGQSGGLFGAAGNTTATSAQSSGSGMFPTLGGTQPPSQSANSLFAPKTQPPSQGGGGGLFGSVTQASQPAGGGLFNSTAQTQPTGGGGLSSGANQSTQPAGGGSLFGSTLGGNSAPLPFSQPGQPSAQQSGQPVKNGDAPRAALFEDLLERGKKRRDVGDDTGALPSLQLGLGDISSKIKGLGNTKPDFSASRAHDSRAHYLLAASGIQQGKTRRDLEAFANDTAAAQSNLAPEEDPRIENYVAGLHAKTMREMMDEAMEQSKRDFDTFLEDNIQINWDYQRRRVYEHLGLVKPDDHEDEGNRADSLSVGARGAFGRSNRRSRAPDASARGSMRGSVREPGMSKSVLGGSIGRGSLRQSNFKDVEEKTTDVGSGIPDDDPYQRARIDRYSSKVKDLNVARIEDYAFPVIEQFARVELDGGSDTPEHLVSAYQALRNIVKEISDVERPSDEGAIRERQYAQDYISDNPNTGASIRLRQQILDGSLKFLEDNFFSQVQKAVDRDPQEANIGGMPTKTSMIRGYLRIREASKNLLPEDQEPQRGESGEPIWATIFYLLRSGLVEEAAQYVADNERVIKTFDRSFPQYIASYASQGRNLPHSLRTRMSREYQQRLNNPAKVNDPYRMACYKVLGRCDVAHPRVDIPSAGIEDLIWLYFALAREANRAEETAGETMGLDHVQSIINDIKDRYFATSPDQPTSAYATCFLLQILGGTFEAAIAYLYQYNQVAAVHFAIALNFYGLLRVSDPLLDMDLLSYTTRQQPQINFARLLGYFTQSFRLSRPEAAADYLILISLNTDLPGEMGQKMSHVTHEALKELTLETREFPLLIGDIRNDGRRIKGVIETRLPLVAKSAADPAAFLRTLTIQAAQSADDAGRINDAALLYHLAEEYDSVITVTNRALSDALSVDVGAEPMRLQPLKPRAKPGEQYQQQQEDEVSSLSLVSVDDPFFLTQNMLSLYNTHALYFSRISEVNRQSAALLLRMWEVRTRIANQRWAEAIDTLVLMDLLPMRAAGNINSIRAASSKLNQQPPVVARNVGNLLIWAIGACGEQRRVLKASGFDVGGRGRDTEQELKQCARDLMVFAGLVKYRIGSDVYEILARAGEGLEQ